MQQVRPPLDSVSQAVQGVGQQAAALRAAFSFSIDSGVLYFSYKALGVRVSTLSGGEVFGLVSTECLSADKDPSSPRRDSGVRFQPGSEGRITAPVMGSSTAGAAPGSPGGAGSAGTEPKPPAYNYQVSSRRDALRSSPSSDTL